MLQQSGSIYHSYALAKLTRLELLMLRWSIDCTFGVVKLKRGHTLGGIQIGLDNGDVHLKHFEITYVQVSSICQRRQILLRVEHKVGNPQFLAFWLPVQRHGPPLYMCTWPLLMLVH